MHYKVGPHSSRTRGGPMLNPVNIWPLSNKYRSVTLKKLNYEIKQCIPRCKQQGSEASTCWQWAHRARTAHGLRPMPPHFNRGESTRLVLDWPMNRRDHWLRACPPEQLTGHPPVEGRTPALAPKKRGCKPAPSTAWPTLPCPEQVGQGRRCLQRAWRPRPLRLPLVDGVRACGTLP